MQYTQDYDEKFPVLRGNAGGSNNNVDGVFVLVQPYLKSTQIFQCPSETTAPNLTAGNPGYTDYAYNVSMGYDFGTNTSRGLAIAALTQSALTVLSCDFDSGYSDSWTNGGGGATNLANFPTGVVQRHLETQNFLFCDGHVKSLKGQNPTTSSVVYNTNASSGNNPTFNNAP